MNTYYVTKTKGKYAVTSDCGSLSTHDTEAEARAEIQKRINAANERAKENAVAVNVYLKRGAK